LRAIYFSLAAFWGFVAGSGAVIASQTLTGGPLPIGGTLLVSLALAALLSLIGAMLAAAAYREAVRRGPG
jgi:hypothetical protein